MRQTYQPAKIILWLSKEQFPNGSGIPASLREREGDIFEIRMVDGDIRSHKKYHYVSKEYPDSLIFLVDDDIYYPTDVLERTIKAHEKNPDSVICNYGYHMSYSDKGELAKYRRWEQCYENSDAGDLFFGSGGGTLIRPSSLYPSLTDIDLAIKLTPLADDIWLNAMVRLNRVSIKLLKNGLLLPVAIKDNVKLASENRVHSKNDEQLTNIINHFVEVSNINPFARIS